MAAPPFNLTKPRFDLDTYYGRYRHFMNVTDPRLLLVTDDRLSKAKSLLNAYEKGALPDGTTDEQLWEARRIKEAIIHPDTGEKVPIFFRMSAFVPANIPICAGMILGPPTTLNAVFWQWFNQSFNAGFNYSNRNASAGDGATQEIVQSYAAATAVACGVALGLSRWVKNAALAPSIRTLVERTVPFVAVATAGASNALLMRYREGIEGVQIMDADGNNHGNSVVAGRVGLAQVAATRVFLPLPILLVPPYILSFINKAKFVSSKPMMKPIVELTVITACLVFAFPAAIALFPQKASLPASALEPEFQNKVDKVGAPITTYYWNKGI